MKHELSKVAAAVEIFAADVQREANVKLGEGKVSFSHFKEYLDATLEEEIAKGTAMFQRLTADALVLQFKKHVDDIVAFIAQLPHETAKILNSDEFSRELAHALEAVVNDLEKMFPPTDEAARHEQREADVRRVLEAVQEAIIGVLVKLGVKEADVRVPMELITSTVVHIVVLAGQYCIFQWPRQFTYAHTGDLAKQHPVLVRILVTTAIDVVIPQYPFLCLFLKVMGFGPAGPVKGNAPQSCLSHVSNTLLNGCSLGSLAAWAQHVVFEAAVSKRGWLSKLQHAAIKGPMKARL